MFDEKFCCRCKEDFPVEDSASWQMGAMRELKRLSKRLIRKHFLSDWLNHDEGKYLCGNCYFDLTDDFR